MSAPRETEERVVDARLRVLEMQHADIAVVMRESVEAGVTAALTNPDVLAKMWAAAMAQGQKGLHERAGRWLFSKWTAILVLIVAVASYIGWPATVKLVFNLVKPA